MPGRAPDPVLTLLCLAVLAAPAQAQLLPTQGPEPAPYGADDGGGFRGAGWDGRFAGLTPQAPSDWRRYVARDAV